MMLENKIALVTGAARGIGKGIAVTLAKAGARVAVADLSVDRLEETVSLIQAAGSEALPIQVDVSEYEQVRAMVQATVGHFGVLDIAVNNAGIPGVAPIWDLRPEDWDRMMKVNSSGVWYACKAEVEVMRPRKFGRIVNISSIGGKVGFAGLTHYSAAKFSVIGITSALAKEVAREGITVNAVCPGMVGTQMWMGKGGAAESWALPGESVEDSWKRHQDTLNPQGEAQTPEDMGEMIVYLANARHVTGQALAVDGGLTL